MSERLPSIDGDISSGAVVFGNPEKKARLCAPPVDGGDSPMLHHFAVSALTISPVCAADRPLSKAAHSSANLTLPTLSAAAL